MGETELELVKKQLEREREESKMWREKYFAVRKELDERIEKNRKKGEASRQFDVETDGKFAYELHKAGKSWREIEDESSKERQDGSRKKWMSFTTARRLAAKYAEIHFKGESLF